MGSEAIWTYIHQFSNHLAKQQPARLSHYTNSSNALNILRKSELWASSLLFMRDSSEAAKALNLCLKLIDKLLERSRMPLPLTETLQLSYSIHPRKRFALYQYLVLSKLKVKLESYLKAEQHVLVLSFSEQLDEASSWSRYALQGGYSLAFSADHLALAGSEQSFSLMPCYYANWQEQATIIQGALMGSLQAWLAQVKELYEAPDDLHQVYLDSLDVVDSEVQRVHDILIQVASLLKDDSSQHEQEWRLVSESVPAEHLHYDERSGRFFPYAPFDFDTTLRDVKLRVADEDLAALGLKGFLASKKLNESVSVSFSRHEQQFRLNPLVQKMQSQSFLSAPD